MVVVVVMMGCGGMGFVREGEEDGGERGVSDAGSVDAHAVEMHFESSGHQYRQAS